jgi:hypothetical protein
MITRKSVCDKMIRRTKLIENVAPKRKGVLPNRFPIRVKSI